MGNAGWECYHLGESKKERQQTTFRQLLHLFCGQGHSGFISNLESFVEESVLGLQGVELHTEPTERARKSERESFV